MPKKTIENTTELVEINKLILNDKNPRSIRSESFIKLKKSIQDFPEMLTLRPIVIDDAFTVLGGNMRVRACIELGLTHVNCVIAKGLTAKQKKEFIIKDNVSFGDWDWDILANEFDTKELEQWGLEGVLLDDTNLSEFDVSPEKKKEPEKMICPKCGEEITL